MMSKRKTQAQNGIQRAVIFLHAPQSGGHSWHPSGIRARLHPYSYDPLYEYFQKSQFHHAAFSAAAVPFAGMMKISDDGIPDRAKAYKIDFRPDLEPDLKFDTP